MAHNLYSINYVWALVAGFLVMFMQAGFMLVETGLCRAKNASHTAAMNLMIYPLGCLAFWVYGFAIGWGNWWNGPVPPGWYPSLGPGLSVLNEGWGLGAAVDAAGKATGAFTYGLIGLKGWFLTGAVDDTAVMVLFFFMMVFMDTTATIPTGAMAERWAWKNFCSVWSVDRSAVLSLCQLGLGRRLAGSRRAQLGSWPWRRRLCRLRCRALDGWGDCACGSDGHWPAHWQIRFAGEAEGDARTRRSDGRARDVYSGLWLVRI